MTGLMEKRELLQSGSTADVYRTDDPAVVLVSRKDTVEDRVSGRSEEIPGKGAVCSRMTNHLYRLLETKNVSGAFVEEVTDTDSLFRDTKQLPFDVIVRNYSAGKYPERTGITEGTALAVPTVEFILKNRELGDPMINGYDVLAMQLATEEEIETLVRTAFRVNEVLTPYFKSINTDLIDMELVFGRGKDGVVLTGELSPGTMRLWDSRTHEKLDKDRFRKGLGNVGDAYREMFGRLNIGRV